MEKIDQLCSTILLIAQSPNSLHSTQVIPKVSVRFDHDGSDIQAGDAWKATATLLGIDSYDDQGKAIVAYEKTWEGKGGTAEGSFAALVNGFKDDVERRRLSLIAESHTIQTSLQALQLLGTPDPTTGIWPTSDPEEAEVEAQTKEHEERAARIREHLTEEFSATFTKSPIEPND